MIASTTSSSLARLGRIALATAIVSAVLLLVCLLTSRNNRTIFGTIMGGDWPAFYDAGLTLRQSPTKLYDLSEQSRRLDQLLPDEPASAALPYANAPWLAQVIAPLSSLGYAGSWLAWTGISIALAAAGLWLAARAAGFTTAEARRFVPLCAAFQPLTFECIHGGQISTIGLFALSATIWLNSRARPILAGLALALCSYKPTLLFLIVPSLLITGQSRMLIGFVAGVTALTAGSLATIGIEPWAEYIRMLAFYGSQSTAGAAASIFSISKFVDLNTFLKLLHVGPLAIGVALVACAAAFFVRIRDFRDQPALLWAALLAGTLVINIYVGVYDTVLVLPALLLLAGRSVQLRGIIIALIVAGWLSAACATEFSIQPMTLAIIVVLLTALRRPIASSDNAKVFPVPATMSIA